MKHVLVTAGCVYGSLDDNKLVGNRIRGIWATKFACWLAARFYSVTLLLPDTFDKASLEKTMLATPPVLFVPGASLPTITARYHNGYEDYAAQCYELAPKVDAAVMAGAVVNWIPLHPFIGKMPTEGYEEGAVQQIAFVLAPRIIDRMRKLNPKLTLIGCKMTSGAEEPQTIRAAYQTLLKAHCNVVVANDLSRLKRKTLVYPDGNTISMENFEQLYDQLKAVLDDEHYRTESHRLETGETLDWKKLDRANMSFDWCCDNYRERFVKRPDGPNGPDRVFGSIAVRIDENNILVSPREKGTMFTSRDAVVVTSVDRVNHVVHTLKPEDEPNGRKATLNAPLLVKVMQQFKLNALVHLHEQQKHLPTLPYAPPGTVRDNDRTVEVTDFNIEGHGCLFVPRY